MHIEIFYHTLPDGQPAKFSIWDKKIEDSTYYFAKVVGTDIDSYKILSVQEREMFFGVHVTDGNQAIVYYRNHTRLKADIIDKYGAEWLHSEM